LSAPCAGKGRPRHNAYTQRSGSLPFWSGNCAPRKSWTRPAPPWCGCRQSHKLASIISCLNARQRIYFRIKSLRSPSWPGIGWLAKRPARCSLNAAQNMAAKQTENFPATTALIITRCCSFPNVHQHDASNIAVQKTTLCQSFLAPELPRCNLGVSCHRALYCPAWGRSAVHGFGG